MKQLCLSLTILLLSHCICMGQTVLFNDYSSIYVIQDGTCNYTRLNVTFAGCPNCMPFSMARYKDTLYVTTPSSLYWMDLKTSTTLQLVANYPNGTFNNNMACDKNGNLWGIAGFNQITSCDPHTGTVSYYGSVNESPSGDLTFLNDKIIYAASSGIYKVDLKNPSAAELVVSSNGYTFLGLVTLPSTCSQNKLYALGYLPGIYDYKLLGIDPDAKTYTGEECVLPSSVLDAASLTEDGTTLGVSIDSVFLQSPCETATTGSATIFAYSASKNPLTYTLDGTTTNSTGIFGPLSVGPHVVHIETQEGCSRDTAFTLQQGLAPQPGAQTTAPLACTQPDGAIDLLASTQASPLLFSINDGPVQTSPHFGGLPAGTYQIKIIDGGHCEKVLPVSLIYRTTSSLISRLTVTPTLCTAKTGAIEIIPDARVDLTTVKVLLNDIPQPQLTLSHLDAGIYKLSLLTTASCGYDTTLTIGVISNPRPVITATLRDPLCRPDDGVIGVTIDGATGPYQTDLNGGAWSNAFSYPGLSDGAYRISIMDVSGCIWDTTLSLRPYDKDIVILAVDSVNPNCRELNSGSVTIGVQGRYSPYRLEHAGIFYDNGSSITGLNDGSLTFRVINGNGCIVDSAGLTLRLLLLPGCDSFFMPNAFTPNGDGNNDRFHPLHSPFLSNFQLLIYNRWGQQVYSTRDSILGWDGTRSGAPLPADSYIWVIQYENFEGKKRMLKGSVMLIR